MQRLEQGQEQRRKPAAGAGWTGNPTHVDDLDISPDDNGYMIYRPQQSRITYLNPTAALILELCNGDNSPEQIADLVKRAYGLQDAPVKDVRETLKHLQAESLLG